MIRPMNWFDRKFSFDFPLEIYPSIVERLRGTPVRLSERVSALPRDLLIRRDGEDWAIQEHAGHLLDLGSLDLARLEDFRTGREILQPADLENRKTYEANHNANTIEAILAAFRAERSALVGQLEILDEAFVQHTALHPRLGIPMRVVDWAFFVAEHDDHHLAQITELIYKFTE